VTAEPVLLHQCAPRFKGARNHTHLAAPACSRRPPQTLTYNHALLALWASNTAVAIADLDEYLLTPHKGSLHEVGALRTRRAAP
jgi:hypothetical protein